MTSEKKTAPWQTRQNERSDCSASYLHRAALANLPHRQAMAEDLLAVLHMHGGKLICTMPTLACLARAGLRGWRLERAAEDLAGLGAVELRLVGKALIIDARGRGKAGVA
jgi:hypothetical protein